MNYMVTLLCPFCEEGRASSSVTYLVFGAIHSAPFWHCSMEQLSFCCSSIYLFLSEYQSDAIFLFILKLLYFPHLPSPPIYLMLQMFKTFFYPLCRHKQLLSSLLQLQGMGGGLVVRLLHHFSGGLRGAYQLEIWCHPTELKELVFLCSV